MMSWRSRIVFVSGVYSFLGLLARFGASAGPVFVAAPVLDKPWSYTYIYIYMCHANGYMGVRTYCPVFLCGILPNPIHGKIFDVAAGRVVLRSIKSSIQCLLEY